MRATYIIGRMPPGEQSAWIEWLVAAGAPGIFLCGATNAAVGQPPAWLVFGVVGWLILGGGMPPVLAVTAWATGYTMGSSAVLLALDRYGRGWLDRLMVRMGRDPAMFERAERWFRRHGVWAVFLARVVPGFGWMITVPAGLSGMRVLPFAVATLLGSGIFAGVLTALAMLLGDQFLAHTEWFRVWGPPVAAVVLVAVGLVWWWRRRRPRPPSAG